eukprot:10344253-Alexandrium_andersonii.AAC.1
MSLHTTCAPDCFAALFHADGQAVQQAVQFLRFMWDCLFRAETSVADAQFASKGMLRKVLQDVVFNEWQGVREFFGVLLKAEWDPTDPHVAYTGFG